MAALGAGYVHCGCRVTRQNASSGKWHANFPVDIRGTAGRPRGKMTNDNAVIRNSTHFICLQPSLATAEPCLWCGYLELEYQSKSYSRKVAFNNKKKTRISPLSRKQCEPPRGRDQLRPMAELCTTLGRTQELVRRLFSLRPLRCTPVCPSCHQAKHPCDPRWLLRALLQ